jgi:flagellar protein FlaG
MPKAPAPVVARATDGVPPVQADAKPAAPVAKTDKPVARAPVSTSTADFLSKEELATQVQALQVKMDRLNPALAFVVDPSSGRALIQLTDRTTKEVIQQFPTEAAMQISKALDHFQKGHLLHLTV